MKPTLLIALLMLVGCQQRTEDQKPTITVQEKPKEQVNRRDKWQPQIKHVRACDYVFWYYEREYAYRAPMTSVITHAGDCPNPIHKERP